MFEAHKNATGCEVIEVMDVVILVFSFNFTGPPASEGVGGKPNPVFDCSLIVAGLWCCPFHESDRGLRNKRGVITRQAQ